MAEMAEPVLVAAEVSLEVGESMPMRIDPVLTRRTGRGFIGVRGRRCCEDEQRHDPRYGGTCPRVDRTSGVAYRAAQIPKAGPSGEGGRY